MALAARGWIHPTDVSLAPDWDNIASRGIAAALGTGLHREWQTFRPCVGVKAQKGNRFAGIIEIAVEMAGPVDTHTGCQVIALGPHLQRLPPAGAKTVNAALEGFHGFRTMNRSEMQGVGEMMWWDGENSQEAAITAIRAYNGADCDLSHFILPDDVEKRIYREEFRAVAQDHAVQAWKPHDRAERSLKAAVLELSRREAAFRKGRDGRTEFFENVHDCEECEIVLGLAHFDTDSVRRVVGEVHHYAMNSEGIHDSQSGRLFRGAGELDRALGEIRGELEYWAAFDQVLCKLLSIGPA